MAAGSDLAAEWIPSEAKILDALTCVFRTGKKKELHKQENLESNLQRTKLWTVEI